MTTAQRWMHAIDAACAERDMAASNRLVTQLHFDLSEALARVLGRSGGPNFHSWAVWGSRKAGVTIRQEDLEDAIGDATRTAGIVGGFVGAATGLLAGRKLHWRGDARNVIIGVATGALTGAWTGRQIALWSRLRAAQLVLEGNHTVLRDIGAQSARFLQLLEEGAPPALRAEFFAGLQPGPTEQHGQDRLAAAFRSYLVAFDSDDVGAKRTAMIEGNCAIVYHEHIRLEPYIRGAMPFIVRRCATQRLMTYDVGDRIFTVGQDLPGAHGSAAHNWAHIDQRMRYVFALFRQFHDAPEVFAAPWLCPPLTAPGYADTPPPSALPAALPPAPAPVSPA